MHNNHADAFYSTDVQMNWPFYYGMMTVEEFQIEYEKDFNVTSLTDNSGNSILHYSTQFGNYELIEFLLKGDIIDPNLKNYNKNTALKIAVQKDDFKASQILLQAGANPNNATFYEDLFILAQGNEIKELLREYSCIETPASAEDFLPSLERLFALKKESGIFEKSHIVNDECLASPTIPHNLHYVWLTDLNNPKDAPENHLNIVTESMTNFRQGTKYNDWNYKFHTNAPNLISNTTGFFQSLGFEILDITEEYKNFRTNSFVDLFIQTKKYGLAVDMARYEIVNDQGGMYLDLNFNLTRSLDKEVCAYPFVNFNIEGSGGMAIMGPLPHPENYFFISRPNHPILIQTINDIYEAFNGPRSQIFYQNLNATNRLVTDILFNKFSFNNLLNLTTENDQGILYNFKSHMEFGQFVNSVETSVCPIFDIPPAFKDFMTKMNLLYATNQVNLVCTNHDLIKPIGYDDYSYGSSWA